MVLKVCSFLTNLSFGKIVILSSECLNSIDLGQIQASIVKDPSVSVKRVLWSPDGSLFGKIKKCRIKQFLMT
jgi:hypothetical protein